ncbi:hypothetical protein LTR41_012040, partial [Exophiala xenobiotica]
TNEATMVIYMTASPDECTSDPLRDSFESAKRIRRAVDDIATNAVFRFYEQREISWNVMLTTESPRTSTNGPANLDASERGTRACTRSTQDDPVLKTVKGWSPEEIKSGQQRPRREA